VSGLSACCMQPDAVPSRLPDGLCLQMGKLRLQEGGQPPRPQPYEL
jgi:hypothetical protein